MYEYRATVVSVHDGDTVTVDIDLGFEVWWHNVHIRMVGINAPEIRVNDPAGYAARDYLRSLIPPGTVILLRSEMDRADKYGGRWLGTLYSGKWAGDTFVHPANLNEAMVTAGHAVVYRP